MVSRILALIVWAAVAASVAYWGLRWFAKPLAVPPGTSSVALGGAPRGDIGKLLKASNAPPDALPAETAAPTGLAARLQLVGVVAPRTGHKGTGVALLVMDGKPARAYKIGHVVEGDQVVQAITQQGVDIGPDGGTATVSLSLPLLPPAATGTLPPVGQAMGAPPMGTPPPPPNAAPGGDTSSAADTVSPADPTRRMGSRLRNQVAPPGLAGQPGQQGNNQPPPPPI